MIETRADRPTRITLGADKGYDAADFVNDLHALPVTPHVACNTARRRSAIDGRTMRQPGYAISQTIRKRIEEGFGWSMEIGLTGRIRLRGGSGSIWPSTSWRRPSTSCCCQKSPECKRQPDKRIEPPFATLG